MEEEGGGGQAPSASPFIAAELNSFPTGSIPNGFNTGASVEVLDDSSGLPITTASVVTNGVPLFLTSLPGEGRRQSDAREGIIVRIDIFLIRPFCCTPHHSGCI